MSSARDVTPRRGLRFEHARFRAHVPGVRVAESPGEVCRVTAVRGVVPGHPGTGTVYYRTDDGAGGKWCTGVVNFADSVRRVLPDLPVVRP